MFDIEGGKIKLSADSLAIPPFRKHHENAKDKAKALKEIEYVVWLCRWDSPYLAYAPNDRPMKIGKDVFDDETYKPEEHVVQLITRFKEFQDTPLIRMYKSAETGLEYLIELLNSLKQGIITSDHLSLEEQLKIGAGVSKILKDVEPTAKSLDSAKKRAMAEQIETGKVKGGGTLGLYEMPRK